MDLRPIDRRGLGEVVAWAAALSATTLLLIATLVKTGSLDHTLLGLFIGQVTALAARGMQSASERSAREGQAQQLELAAKSFAARAEEAARRAEDAATEDRSKR